MKLKFKLLIAASLSALMLCGCETEREKAYRQKRQRTTTEYPYPIYEVEYKGHDYIVFGGTAGAGHGMYSGQHSGVVHSPDCEKCKTGK